MNFSCCNPVVVLLLLGISLSFSVDADDHVLVVTELSPPYQIIEKGEIAGTSTAIVREVLFDAKVNAKFKMMPWPRAFQIASTRANTLIYSMVRNPQRENNFTWIGPVLFYKVQMVSLSRRDDIQIASEYDLQQYNMALLRNGAIVDHLKSLGITMNDRILEVADSHQAWHLLINDRVDLIASDTANIQNMVKKLGLLPSAIQTHDILTGLTNSGYLAASKDFDPLLLNAIMDSFERHTQSDSYPYANEINNP